MSNLALNITRSIFTGIANDVTGGTFHVDGRTVPTFGYFIGGAAPTLLNPRPAAVLDFIETAPSDYVGYWEDSETGALYVDAVDWTPSEAYARRLCATRGELAYWDAGKGEEVRVSDASYSALVSV